MRGPAPDAAADTAPRAARRLFFLRRHLDPTARLNEAVFGLIMVLTFTLGAGLLAPEGDDRAFDIVLAAVGCNVAWGVIDSVLYIMTCLFERGQAARVRREVEGAPSEAHALALIRERLPDALRAALDDAEQDALCQRVLERISRIPEPASRITRDDLLGAIASGWLVIMVCIPAALPFLIIPDDRAAMRVSNGLLIGMLFLTGLRWARCTGQKWWLVAPALSGVGLALVAVAIALGG